MSDSNGGPKGVEFVAHCCIGKALRGLDSNIYSR